MEPYIVLLIICTMVSPLFGRDHSGSVQTIDFPQDKPTYSGNRGDDLSETGSQSQVVKDYQSGKCYTYEGYLNDMLPIDYFDDPVNDLKRAIRLTDLESVPDEKYYLTVIKTNDAYQRGLIKSARTKSSKTHSEGMKTQVYLLSPGFFEDRLISHTDISRAREYFNTKVKRECGTPLEHNVYESNHENKDVGKVVQGGEKKCLSHEQIRDLKEQMEKIDVNSHPGATYYKLVLKTNRAVHCNQLTVIEGTLNTGALGLKTELYIVEEDQIRMRLPTTRDRRQARAFFKERKYNAKGIHNTEPSFSSSIENDHKSKIQASASIAGEERNQAYNNKEPSYPSSYEVQSNNNRKLAAAAAGASLVTHKTGQYSSDESTHAHERSRLIASPVGVPSSVDRGSRRSKVHTVPPTETTKAALPSDSSSQAPMLVDYQPLQDLRPQIVVNTGNPAIFGNKGGSVIEEEVKFRVKVEADVSIKSRTVS